MASAGTFLGTSKLCLVRLMNRYRHGDSTANTEKAFLLSQRQGHLRAPSRGPEDTPGSTSRLAAGSELQGVVPCWSPGRITHLVNSVQLDPELAPEAADGVDLRAVLGKAGLVLMADGGLHRTDRQSGARRSAGSAGCSFNTLSTKSVQGC